MSLQPAGSKHCEKASCCSNGSDIRSMPPSMNHSILVTRFRILAIPKSQRQRKPKWPAKLMHPNDSYLRASVKTVRVVGGKMQKLV